MNEFHPGLGGETTKHHKKYVIIVRKLNFAGFIKEIDVYEVFSS